MVTLLPFAQQAHATTELRVVPSGDRRVIAPHHGSCGLFEVLAIAAIGNVDQATSLLKATQRLFRQLILITAISC